MVNYMRISEKLDFLLVRKGELNNIVDTHEKLIKQINKDIVLLKENEAKFNDEKYSLILESDEYKISKYEFIIEDTEEEIARIGRKRIELQKKIDSGEE